MNLLEHAIKEAERFLESAKQCKMQSGEFVTGCKYRSDTKRKSMCLTRSLADLRRADLSQWRY